MKIKNQLTKSKSMSSMIPNSYLSLTTGEMFLKINQVKETNIKGKKALVIFKKPIKIPTIFDLMLNSSEYITDGGLKKKCQRFKGNCTFMKSSIDMICTPKNRTNKSNNLSLSKSVLNHSMKTITPKNIRREFNKSLISSRTNDKRSTDLINSITNTKLHPHHYNNNNNCENDKSNNDNNTIKHRHCLSPEVKIDRMEKLVEKAIYSKIREYSADKIKTPKQGDVTLKQKKYLEENGIELNQIDFNIEEEKKVDTKSKEERYNNHYKKKLLSNKANNTLSQSLSLNSKLSPTTSRRGINEDSSQEKKLLKPQVDQFEFINKINIEIKRRSKDFQSLSSKRIVLNNSFRKSFDDISYKTKNKDKKDNKHKEHNSLNILYHSNNYSEKELASFTLSKKHQQNDLIEQKTKQNNQKLFMIYKNLYNLSQKLQFRPKKKPKMDLFKDKNQSPNKQEISTVIESDDYYTSILTSKQLLKKTRSDFERQKRPQKLFNRNIIQQAAQNVHKSTNSKINYIDSTNHNQSTAQYSIQQKAIQTILKTNNILSRENYDQLASSEKKCFSSFQNIFRVNTDKLIKNAKQLEENKDSISPYEKERTLPLNKLVISIDSNATNYNETKDKNLPSLSHVYTINNTITNNKKIMEPRMILNLVMIVKLLIQRKVFYMFYEEYYTESMIQRYTIAFIYFNALVKHRTFYKIACYANLKLEYLALCQLFKPFIKRSFKAFVSNCHLIRKLKYFVNVLLNILRKKGRQFILINKLSSHELDSIKNDNKSNEERLATVDSCSSIDKSEKMYSNYKMNTYLYETFSVKSEYTVEPNSVDSHKLHKLHLMLQQNDSVINEGQLLENDLNDYNTHKYNNNHRKEFKAIGKYSPDLNRNLINIKSICKPKSSQLDSSKSIESFDELQKKTQLDNSKDASQKSKNEVTNLQKKKHNLSPLNSLKEDSSKEENELNTSRNIKRKKEGDTEEEYQYEFQDNVIKEEDDNKDSSHSQRNIIEGKGSDSNRICFNAKDTNTSQTDEDILAEKDHLVDIEWVNPLTMSSDDYAAQKNLNVNKSIELKINQQENINNRYEDAVIEQNNNEDNQEKGSSTTIVCLTPTKDNNKDKDIIPINPLLDPKSDRKLKKETTKQQESLTNANILVDELIAQLIDSEITNSKSIIPVKQFKFELKYLPINNSNSLSSSNSQGNQSLIVLTDNMIIMNYAYLSFFNKTIREKKKDQSINLYLNEIFPLLLVHIKKEIENNYKRIYNNIVVPIRSNPQGLMASLTLEDADMLRENYKRLIIKRENFELLKKDKIMRQFKPIHKLIRAKDQLITNDSIDVLLNECVIDTAIEIINKKRLYGENGEPLPWSSRNKQLGFNYSITDPTKLINEVEKELVSMINFKMGIVSENYDYFEPEILNIEREKRLITNILQELNEENDHWTNLEMEETQVILELSEIILDQLYREVIVQIEHIHQLRKNSKLYDNKSIYSCKHLPDLTFCEDKPHPHVRVHQEVVVEEKEDDYNDSDVDKDRDIDNDNNEFIII